MKFKTIGQQTAKKLISNAVQNGPSHSYLFHGPAGVGKKNLSLEFANALLCESNDKPCGTCTSCLKFEKRQHERSAFVEPDGESIKIEQIRELKKLLKYGVSEGQYFVICLYQIEKLTPEAANSFLKILEEPPVGVVFIAATALKEACLPTILSRFLEVPFRHLTSAEVSELIKEQTYSEIIKKVISFNGSLEGLGQIENESLETFFENITNLKQLPEYAIVDLSKTIFEQKVYLFWLKSYLSYIQNTTALKKLTHFSDSFFKNPLMIENLFFEMTRVLLAKDAA